MIRAAGLIGAGCAAVLGSALLPVQAAAAGGMLELSRDGRVYTTVNDWSVLDDSFVYVPGSSSLGFIWVRNGTDEDTRLSVAAVTGNTGEQLARNLGLEISSGAYSSGRVALGGADSCSALTSALPLKPREAVRLDVELDLATDSNNSAMGERTQVDLKFLLEPAAVPGVSGSLCTDDSPGVAVVAGDAVPGAAGAAAVVPVLRTVPEEVPASALAATGADVWVFVVGGALAVVAGVLAVAAAGRRRTVAAGRRRRRNREQR